MLDRDVLKQAGFSDELTDQVLVVAQKIRRSAECLPDINVEIIRPEIVTASAVYYSSPLMQASNRFTLADLPGRSQPRKSR